MVTENSTNWENNYYCSFGSFNNYFIYYGNANRSITDPKVRELDGLDSVNFNEHQKHGSFLTRDGLFRYDVLSDLQIMTIKRGCLIEVVMTEIYNLD